MIALRVAATLTGMVAMFLMFKVDIGPASIVLAVIFGVAFVIVAWTFGAFGDEDDIATPLDTVEDTTPEQRAKWRAASQYFERTP